MDGPDEYDVEPFDEGDAGAWAEHDHRVRGVAADLLAEAGPLEMERLVDLLAETGVLDRLLEAGYEGDELVDTVDDILIGSDEFLQSVDGRIAHADTLLDGLVLTHRVSQGELDRAVLDMTPDLDIIDWDGRDGMAFATGGRVRREFPSDEDPALAVADDNGSLFGPPGWLDGIGAGDLVALTRTGETIGLQVIDGPPVESNLSSSPAALALAAAFERQIAGDDTVGAEPGWTLTDALVHDPSLFRVPGPPLRDLVDAIGLELKGAWMGRADAEWDPPFARRRRMALEQLYDRYQFDTCCIEAFELVRSGWSEVLVGHEPEPEQMAGGKGARAVAKALAHGAVAPALAEEIFGLLTEGSDRLDAFARTVAAAAPGTASGSALWLQATNALHQGRNLDAERGFGAAVRADPDLAGCYLELARFASDRGDAARALSLYAKAGTAPDDPDVRFLRTLVPDWSGIGRNEPCPCGSGRKFKQCHLGRGAAPLPIEQRAAWLANKVNGLVLSPQHRTKVVGLASTALEALGSDELDELDEFGFVQRLRDLIGDPFLVSVATGEGGGLEAFIEQRGELLPPDELALAEAWAHQHRRLWEVTSVERGVSLTLRDTATGDTVTVAERSGSAGAETGQYLLAVVVPVGGEHQIMGAVLDIPLRLRSSALSLLDVDPSADEVADWYGWTLRAPTLVNREGEPTVARTGRVTPSLPWDAFADALDRFFDRSGGDDVHHWVEHHRLGPGHDVAAPASFDVRPPDRAPETPGDVIVRAFLRRDGDDLLVDTNSDARWERIVAVLDSIDPAATVEELPIADLEDEGHGEGGAWSDWSPLGTDLDDPELDEMLAAFIAAKETEWLDEQIPALGGLTPRQAADDPTRREDLLALLRSFDADDTPPGAATFDPDRIRAALGLDGGAT